MKYPPGTRDYEVLRFNLAYPLGGQLKPLAQIRDPPARVVGISREKMNATLVEHPFTPVSRISAKDTRKRTGRDLHPNPRFYQSLDSCVMRVDPGQALGMGDDGHIVRHQQIEEKLL